MSRVIPVILLIAVLAIGGGLIASTAYQAGVSTAVTTAVADGAAVVAPVLPAYGYSWHPLGFGLGVFGFLGTLFFLFLVFSLIRAIFSRGGHGRHGGWGPGGWGPGPGGPGRRGHGSWETHLGESFEEWHRRAHVSDSPGEPPAPSTASTTAPTTESTGSKSA